MVFKIGILVKIKTKLLIYSVFHYAIILLTLLPLITVYVKWNVQNMLGPRKLC